MIQSEEGSTDLNSHLPRCVLNVLWALTAGNRFSSNDAQLTALINLMSKRSKAFDMSGGILNQLPFLAYVAPEWSGYNLITSLNKELHELLQVLSLKNSFYNIYAHNLSVLQ